MLCRSAFPLVPVLGSTNSAADRSALFVGFPATMTGSDFSDPCIIGYGSSPSRCGPSYAAQTRHRWPNPRSPSFRCDPFARDVALDPGRASAPRNDGAAHVAFERMKTLGPCDINLSRLNPTPHAIAVYASQPLSPGATQHSLPSGRYSLLGPDFHRLDRTSLRLAHSFNNLVGAGEQSRGQVEPYGSCGPLVDHKFKLCRLFDR